MGSVLDGKTVLVTGGTGSFGRRFISTVLRTAKPRKVIVFSRDELKQVEMQKDYAGEKRLRYFLGDVRDRERCYRAFDGVDVLIHAAALKQIPTAEYNPFEVVRTNILGAQNIIDAAIDRRVGQVVALSTDKASSPINLYGATKLVSDKLFTAGNSYVAEDNPCHFAVVRYGNVVGSRGSVIPLFKKLAKTGTITLTDTAMTRFWITLDQAVELVMTALNGMKGGEIFVPKIPSMRMTDLAEAIAPDAKVEMIGIRPGEKLHEEMISVDDSRRTLEREDHYVILPSISTTEGFEGKPVPAGFHYSSDKNDQWLSRDELMAMLDD